MCIRHDAEDRDAAEPLQHLEPRGEDAAVAPKLVDDGTLDTGSLFWLEKGNRAIKLGKDTAAVDIADEQHRRVNQLRQTHIDEIALLEVDFGGAARTLDHDDVIFRSQTLIGRHDGREQLALAGIVVHGAQIAQDAAVHDNLAAGIGGGLEQDGVHAHVGCNPRRLGLDNLGAAHLAAGRGDKRIEGHILALKGGHAVTVLPENTAECGGEQALAHVGHGALEHDVQCHDGSSIQRRSAVSSAAFSSCKRTAVRYQPGPSPE